MASSFLVYRSVSYTLSDYISIGIVIQLRGGGGGIKGKFGWGCAAETSNPDPV